MFLLPRVMLWAMFIVLVWVVGGLLPISEIALAWVLAAVNLVYLRFQEDVIDRIVPRFSVSQLSGR